MKAVIFLFIHVCFNNEALKQFVHLRLLFQLNDTSKANIDKLLTFAKQNQLQLSLIDDEENNLFLPGEPLSPDQLTKMIEKSRKSRMISMQHAHQIIRDNYNAG